MRFIRFATSCRWVLSLLVLLALGGALYLGIYRIHLWILQKPVLGKLTFSTELNEKRTFDVGRFEVSWTPAHGGKLSITHNTIPNKSLWESLPAIAFIHAGHGKAAISERRGMFTIRESRPHLLHNQHIHTITLENQKVLILGEWRDNASGSKAYYRFELWEDQENVLAFALNSDDPSLNRLYLTYASDPEECFFGFGEQFTRFNLKGSRLPIFVSEQGIGRGSQPLTFLVNLAAGAGGSWYTTYAPVPHYLSSKLRSLYLDTYAYSVFDMRYPHFVQIQVYTNVLQGGILAGQTPAELIEAYTTQSGRMHCLPDWILEGAVVGIQGGTERVHHVWQQMKSHDVPVAAFWLQDWVGQRTTIVGKQLWWHWELDSDHYPLWDELRDALTQDGIRIMTYVNPFLIDPETKRRFSRNFFHEATTNGYLIKKADGQPYLIQNTDFSAALVDLSNPSAYDWMKAIIRDNLIGTGASGWMADFGEALPCDALLHSGESAEVYHNRYPEVWAKLNREVIEETGTPEDYVFFMRSGYQKSPNYATLFWLGDQMTSWDAYDGIKTAVTGLLSSGISGYAFNHSDIGGYTAVALPLFTIRRTPDLLMRWMELNAFTTIFRTHEGINPELNHQIYSDVTCLSHFSRCAKMYVAWEAYRKQLVREAAETGLPVVRHPFIHYPDDKEIQKICYEQFMVGDVFMIAPVLDPGEQSVECYLPAGCWTHLWTNHVYPLEQGKRVVVDAPLGKPAVFFKTDAPPAVQFVNKLQEYKLL